MELQIKNNTLELFPQKALYWKEEACLVLSDLHIGKILHFRKAGIAVPPQALQNNFDRLDELLEMTHAQRVIFTGDVFHSDHNYEWELFHQWRHRHKNTDMDLVLGNHDRLTRNFENDFMIKVHENKFDVFPFSFTHHPQTDFSEEEYVICGHLHPIVRLTGPANQQFRFPCFHFGKNQAILPSFGYFTGGYVVDMVEDDHVIAVVKNKLMAVSVF